MTQPTDPENALIVLMHRLDYAERERDAARARADKATERAEAAEAELAELRPLLGRHDEQGLDHLREAEESWAERDKATELLRAHQEVESPRWDTKVNCACGEQFTSRCEWALHRGRAIDAFLADIETETER